LLIRIIAVGIGSFFGGIIRYVISGWAADLWGAFFPYGTLIVNVTGSFIMSFIMVYGAEVGTIDTNLRLFIATGMMGALTTFSTFSYETFQFLREGSFLIAGINIAINLVLGIIAVLGGLSLAKMFV